MDVQAIISRLYEQFNQRNIDDALQLVHADVEWANGWQGGFVHGHEGIRQYWTAQWKEITPFVHPISISGGTNDNVQVLAHQVVHDKNGKLLVDVNVRHVFFFKSGLIKKFQIEVLDQTL